MSVHVAASCVHHPARSAVGICVTCRARVCAECVTKIDGINHCVGCYDARAAQATEATGKQGAAGSTALASIAGFGLVLIATTLYWLLLGVGLPGG